MLKLCTEACQHILRQNLEPGPAAAALQSITDKMQVVLQQSMSDGSVQVSSMHSGALQPACNRLRTSNALERPPCQRA